MGGCVAKLDARRRERRRVPQSARKPTSGNGEKNDQRQSEENEAKQAEKEEEDDEDDTEGAEAIDRQPRKQRISSVVPASGGGCGSGGGGTPSATRRRRLAAPASTPRLGPRADLLCRLVGGFDHLERRVQHASLEDVAGGGGGGGEGGGGRLLQCRASSLKRRPGQSATRLFPSTAGQETAEHPLLDSQQLREKQQMQEQQRFIGSAFVAMFSYAARTEEEISFVTSDVMQLLDPIDLNWWYVEHRETKARGFVPAALVALQNSVESQSAEEKQCIPRFMALEPMPSVCLDRYP